MKNDKVILLNQLTLTQKSIDSSKYYIFSLIFLGNCLYYILVSYPQALENYLLATPYNFTSFQYGIFYAVMSLPNIVLPLFVGINADKHGNNNLFIMILLLFSVVGMIITTVGAYQTSFVIMLIGRLIMGLGIENIAMYLKKFLIQIITKEDSVAAWGVFLASARIGCIISSGAPAYIYAETESVTYCFFIAFLISFALAIVVIFTLILVTRSQPPKLKTTNKKSSFELLREFKQETPGIYWVLTVIYCLNFCMFYGFFSSANGFLTNMADLDTLDASYMLIVFSILCSIFQPLSGLIFSSIGYYASGLLLGCLINVIAFVCFILLYGTFNTSLVLIPLLLLAIGYSFSSTFVISASGLIVSSKNHGLAYGMYQNCYNIGFLCGPLIFGYIQGVTTELAGYFWAFIETIGILVIIFILGVVVIILDRKTTKILNVKLVTT